MRGNDPSENCTIEEERELIQQIDSGLFDRDVTAMNSLDLSEKDFNEIEEMEDELW